MKLKDRNKKGKKVKERGRRKMKATNKCFT
jgi:hypothetical protein